MKSNSKNIVIILVGLTLVIATIVGTVFASKKYLTSRDTAKESTSDCRKSGKSYEFVIENDVIVPSEIQVTICDSITVINRDNKQRLLAFGEHEDHGSYQGMSDLPLAKGQNVTFVAATKGTFLVHDHNQDEVSATFIVQ